VEHERELARTVEQRREHERRGVGPVRVVGDEQQRARPALAMSASVSAARGLPPPAG
jgi:hypothetical protein